MDSTSNKSKIISKKVLDFFFSKEKEIISSDFSNSYEVTFDTTKHVGAISSKLELYNTIDSEKAWGNFEQKLKPIPTLKKNTFKINSSQFLKYAAVAIGISLSIFFFIENLSKNESIVLSDIKNPADTIKLYTFGGGTIDIDVSKNDTITQSNGQHIAVLNGKELNYHAVAHNRDKEMLIQELEVPFGQTFRIVLSDGTKVYCDAGTKLQFPVKFPESGDRIIKLTGQAFFDVVSDAENPFIVDTKNVAIKVLGTQFNVSAYDNSNNTQTVLAEGLVKIKLKGENASKLISLVPGEMATYNNQSKRINIKAVDTYNYTAWMSQKLVFKAMSFSSILKTLERKFNVTIINQNEALAHEIFTAKFTNETLDKILNAFKVDNDFSYTIKNNQIIIK